MRWLVADSLYCAEQFPFSHLDSYSYYLHEAGEFVRYTCLNLPLGSNRGEVAYSSWDRLFMLDRYASAMAIQAEKRIAQVAAVCSPMPWEVRKPDGAPAFDLVISSIPWMVEAARAAGCRAEYQALAFDLRCRAAVMGVKREKKAIFVGTRSPAHPGRERALTELADIIEIVPPVYGREFFRTLASATVLVQPHLEWARGCANSMKLYESVGLGTAVIYDGKMVNEPRFGWGDEARTPRTMRDNVASALRADDARECDERIVLAHHTYECADRVPRLIEWSRSL